MKGSKRKILARYKGVTLFCRLLLYILVAVFVGTSIGGLPEIAVAKTKTVPQDKATASERKRRGKEADKEAKTEDKKPTGVALLVGNGVINGDLYLPGAPATACLLSHHLEPLGFKVMQLQNPDVAELRRQIALFARKARKADYALIHYSGYSVGWKGANRILPADSNLRSLRRFLRRTVPVAEMLKALARANKAGILLLDGGYEPPGLKRLKKKMGKRNARRLGTGMARIRPPSGVAVLLATPVRKKPSSASVGRLAFSASQALWNAMSPRPVSDLLRSMAAEIASRNGYKMEELLYLRLASGKGREPIWPFLAEQQENDEISFDWEAAERDPEKVFESCRKMAILKMQRQRAIQACKKVLVLSDKRGDILRRYEQLEERYPRAPCVAELQKRRERILETRRWKHITKSPDIEAIRNFLKRFPNGIYASKARARLEKLIEEQRRRERKAFAEAKREGTWLERIERLKKFLEEFPDSKNADEARRLLERYRMQERARVSFLIAKESRKLQRLRDFIKEFPDSAYVGNAEEEIRKILAEQEREKRLWARAKNTDDLGAYKAYIEAFPKGEYAQKARKRLAELKKAARRKAVEEECRRLYGGDFIAFAGNEEEGFECRIRGVLGVRFIPARAKRYKDWYFVEKSNGICEIWTYPYGAEGGEGFSGKEPGVRFWRKKSPVGDSLGFGITPSRIWDEDASISLTAGEKIYMLSRGTWWMKPRKTGATSVSGEVTKALAMAEAFTVHGQSSAGKYLILKFSAMGFQKSFHIMAERCGMGILTWVDDWSAVATSRGGFYWNSGYSTRKKAVRNIMKYCRRENGGGCQLVTAFRNKCFALFRALDGGWSWAVAKSVDEAKESAKFKCNFTHEGCYLAATICADGSHNYKNIDPPVPSLTWKMSSNAPYPVELQFYSQSRSAVWPGSNRVWVIDDYEVHTYRLSCRWGEKICYGAWPSNNPSAGYWGCGYNCRQSCVNCCRPCKGQTVGPIELKY